MIAKAFILIFAIASLQRACAINHRRRIPVHLDINKEMPEEIKIYASEAFRNGVYYFIKRSIAAAYRIGDVTCGEKMIYPGDVSDFDRFVFVADLPNDQRYLRVVCKTRNRSGIERRVVEFLANPDSCEFTRIKREPVEIDLLIQDNTEVIEVEEDPRTMTKRFSIRGEAVYKYTLGIVRYGIHTLNRKIQNLTGRIIVWTGGMEDPKITVISRYADGIKTEIKYIFSSGKFLLDHRKISEYFLKPWDEREVDQNKYHQDSQHEESASSSTSTQGSDTEQAGPSTTSLQTIDASQLFEKPLLKDPQKPPERRGNEQILQPCETMALGYGYKLFQNTEYEWAAGKHASSRSTYPAPGFYHDFVEEAYKQQGLTYTDSNFYQTNAMANVANNAAYEWNEYAE